MGLEEDESNSRNSTGGGDQQQQHPQDELITIPITNNNNNNNDSNETTPGTPLSPEDGSKSPVINVEESEREFKSMAAHLEMESTQYRLDTDKNDLEGRSVFSEEDFKLKKYFEDSQRMALEHGGKPKKMGVTVKNVTVVGKGADVSIIPDMMTPIKFFFGLFNPFSWKRNDGTKFNILNNVNTFCKDGEMLLVLGRPGAGCSTLLRIISNQRDGYVDVKGDVNYGGIAAEEWSRYRGEAIYTPEEDAHHPMLNVQQTLDFTLKCKTPGNRLPDETKRNFRTKIYDLLLNMFGMKHTALTNVGNEWVPGLSGGERKRMTIMEAMVSAAPITCWDCSTRGLDAASALDYAKSLRIMSDTLNKTTVASFYQASDSIYNLFDRVLVLEKGKVIFFGEIGKAKQYFMDLGFDCEPRKSTPDFLTGVTNPMERKVRPGFEGRVPETSTEFEEAWLASPLYQVATTAQQHFQDQIQLEQPHVQFVEQVRAEKSRTTPKSRAYTTSFVTQVIALSRRQFTMIWRDKFSLFSRYISVLIQSFIYGSLFFQQKSDLSGLFTRGGAIFSSLMFNAFLSQGELAGTFMGRRILQKHRSYALYRPSAFHIAQVVTDFPIIFAQVFLYSIIAYFMFGLQYRADQFFIFCFTLIGITLCLTNLFRMFGNFAPSMYVAQNVMSIYLIFMMTYAGYTIPYDKMHPWFQWFFWVNPFAFAFKALMANEFMGLEFDCSMAAIPYGPTYTSAPNRICPSGASSPGEMILTGEEYLTTLSFKTSDRAYSIIVVYAWWLLFTALNMIAMEKFDWTSGGYTHKVFKPGKAPKLNDINDEREQIRIVKEATEKIKGTLELRGGVFTWQDVRYTVPVPGGKKLLLDSVEGWIKPFTMTALMGASGAGKSTLLDVLAKRKTLGVVEGKTTLNGKALEIDFERITGYVEQMDVFNPHLTIREALQFSAKMRQEPTVPLKEKYQYVEEVLKMMEMSHLGDALIGSLESGVGISVEERKRLTIGIELVAKPHILFLDEPTSGLDAQSSYNIIKFIRKLADAGMPLVCTIHQPSSVLFEHFDRLLLLAKGGKTVYFGDIGDRSATVSEYFHRHGFRTCTPYENPAEYILEAIGAGVHGKTDVDWPAAWKQSPECRDVHQELARLETTEIATGSGEKPREFASGTMYQLWEVYKHLNIVWWRDPFYSFGRFFQAILVGLIIGFTYFNLQSSSSDMNSRIFFIFQALILSIMLVFLALPQFYMQREYFRREYASKYYSWFPFSVSIVFVEIPYVIATGTIFFFCSYWTSGLDYNAETGFLFWFVYNLFLLFCVSFGQLIAALIPHIFFAMIITPLLIVFLFLFCGVMVPYSQIPAFWRNWVYHLNPARYFLESIVTDVLKDVKVECTSSDLIYFDPPAGQTCGEYTQLFSSYAPGYVTNLSGTSDCGYCVYKNGAEYYEGVLDWDAGNRWRNVGIIIGFWIFNIILVIAFVYLTRKGRR